MAFFELNSKVVIKRKDGKIFQFSGVNDVVINSSIKNIFNSAMLKLPSKGSIIRNGQAVAERLTTGLQFSDRDEITISLGYNGELKEEFRGFIKRRDLNMPLLVECEGFVQKLRLDVSVTKNFNKQNTSAKDLLELACAGTGIKVQCPVDIPLAGITLVKADGVRIVDYIKQACENVVTIFFIEPDVLWCGLVYGAYAEGGGLFSLPTVKYRLGYNTPRNNGLKQRVPNEPVQVILKGKYATGVQIFTESKAKYAKSKLQSLNNHVPDADLLGRIAQEKEYKKNYTGFEGNLTAFLVPFAKPGYDAYIEDTDYEELKGTYVIEGVRVEFGMNGGRRICSIGPKVGFDK